jgi:D-arabinose 1-dehydrogenase-like Zn-dependent alcohol dehydrogenase
VAVLSPGTKEGREAAGVRRFGDAVQVLDLPGPRALRPDEVLIDVRACGMGNWDDIARTGAWDLEAGRRMDSEIIIMDS